MEHPRIFHTTSAESTFCPCTKPLLVHLLVLRVLVLALVQW